MWANLWSTQDSMWRLVNPVPGHEWFVQDPSVDPSRLAAKPARELCPTRQAPVQLANRRIVRVARKSPPLRWPGTMIVLAVLLPVELAQPPDTSRSRRRILGVLKIAMLMLHQLLQKEEEFKPVSAAQSRRTIWHKPVIGPQSGDCHIPVWAAPGPRSRCLERFAVWLF
ncbi:hypothetical protein LI328DRAFT_117532 [Trichoderma asperelloides]|nr:hypothetical protein LI328DRAFT_117532 [Trichoderma asperelloides]